MSKKTAVEVYALVVCLVAVACFLVSMITGLYDVVRVASPQFTLNPGTWGQHASNDAYWQMIRPHCWGERSTNCDDTAVRPSEDELTRRRTEALASQYVQERRSGAQGLVYATLAALVSSAIFVPHWLLAKRASNQWVG